MGNNSISLEKEVVCTVDIGCTIASLIKASGKTTKAVAKECGLPEQTLYAMEKAKSDKVSLSGLHKLATYFEKTLEYFLDPEAYREPIVLTAEERVLLTSYRSFNEQGQRKLEEYIKDLGISGRYKKNSRQT